MKFLWEVVRAEAKLVVAKRIKVAKLEIVVSKSGIEKWKKL